MKNLPLQLMTLLALFIVSFNAVSQPENWSKIDRNIVVDLENLDEEILLSRLALQQPTIRTNLRILTEIAVQHEYRFIAMAGITGLRHLDPALAYRTALAHVWSSTNMDLPLVPFLTCLTNEIPFKDFRSAFSAVAILAPGDLKITPFIIEQIPVNQLVDWFMSQERRMSSVTVEAIVIECLLAKTNSLTPVQLTEIRTAMEELRNCPGIPLAIYLLHSNITAEALASNVKCVLEDSTVDIILKQMLFKKYANKLNGLLNVDRMVVSDKEKQRYKDWLMKYSHLN